MKKIHFALVKLPVISITLFFCCCFFAALIHPGSEKEIIDFKMDRYSFTHNFLSELGSFKTNTDETNPLIIQEDNTPSMLLFNGSLIFIGATLVLFYIQFKEVFIQINDTDKAQKYGALTKPLGILAGILYAGVGFVPHDLHFGGHVFFANGAFLVLFFLCVFHSISIYHSKFLSNRYAFGYLLFCVVLFVYLRIIFFGPQIGPGKIFTENELMLQVIAQKSIVLTFMISILAQVYGFKQLLRNY